jgi:hypothetical protein
MPYTWEPTHHWLIRQAFSPLNGGGVNTGVHKKCSSKFYPQIPDKVVNVYMVPTLQLIILNESPINALQDLAQWPEH